ncbi:MAG: type I glyceraldehyde-3-phosphate dehydrogenase [Candidatus Magasanikbacteria bacterium CG10_big_fil_rev_8_21_14_0_10_40_10]|uniref:Glyceraldehyde-3-phosphate dehydrogenase n=1 Tax=Candidatus Magasanikbacteria bacterium CG10_big_fil_rev_8_21_14_0_10_40_10 TaxID=1974648 RepID=A0A2M6W599_9BACT|nr:MAG: type I glyceraldehyde-3-phosphate dehydrogenase [Candidatus Magasanikbacteria bacterium CG10_big_fil_rev_8_21_14_0_10_40_10]
MNIAINGFGRIGRHAFKEALSREGVNLVAINDITDNKTLAHLLKYDSTYGRFNGAVGYDEENLIVAGKKIRVYAEKDPSQLPWGELKVDVVLECTGRFRDKETASLHIKAGAKKVIVSAPAKGDGVPMYVRGVNCGRVGQEQAVVIDNASCTTNCIAPVIAVLQEKWGIEKAMMSTVHGYTADQNLQDGPHKDLRRARAAAINIIPTSTGAAKAVGKVIPDVKGLFDGFAIRVPVPTVSLADMTMLLKKEVSVEEVNNALVEASKTERFDGVLTTTADPVVSSDIVGNKYSSIVDLALTNVVGGNLVKVVSWYDNESGYARRLVEMAVLFGK